MTPICMEMMVETPPLPHWKCFFSSGRKTPKLRQEILVRSEVSFIPSQKDFQCFPLFQPDICYLYITPSPMRFPMKQPIMAMKPQKLHSGGGGGDIIVSLKVWYYQSGWHRETENYELRISSEWRLRYSAASASTAFSRWELPHWLRWPPPPT